MTEPISSDNVSRAALFDSIVKEASEFYKLVLTVASAFLGGTLIFLEKIAPPPVPWWLFVLLCIGWLCLITAICILAIVRTKNLESGCHALDNNFEAAQAIDAKKERYTEWTLWLLIAGVCCITLFGIINLGRMNCCSKQPQEEKTMSEREKTDSQKRIDSSVPYGRTGPGTPSGEIQKSIPYGRVGAPPPKNDSGGGPSSSPAGNQGNQPANTK